MMTNIRDLLFNLTVAKLCGVTADLSAKNQVAMRLDGVRPDTLIFLAGATRDPALAAKSGMAPATGHRIYEAGVEFRKQFRKALPVMPLANVAFHFKPRAQAAAHLQRIAGLAAVPAQKLMLAILAQGGR
jgi:hypothetical protein